MRDGGVTAARLATILGTLFGLQALRAFFPLLLYVLKDRYGLSSISLGGIGIAVFALAFVVPRVVRGPGGLFRAFVALLAARGALQFWTGDPAVSLGLAAVGVVAFFAFLAARGPGRAVGFLVGALLDVSLHAAFGTRDLHWGGSLSSFVAGALIGTAILVARACRRDRSTHEASAPALGVLAWGPFLFLQLELLGNVARFSARTALPTCFSGVSVAAGFVLAATLGPHVARARMSNHAAFPWIAATCLGLSVLRAETTGLLAAPLLWIAQVTAALLLIRALDARDFAAKQGDTRAYEASAVDSGPRAAAMGAGSVLLIVLLFLHYAGYDLRIPFDRTAGKLVAVAALLVAALPRRTGAVEAQAFAPRGWFAAACVAIALLPLLRGVPTSRPSPRDEGGVPASRPSRDEGVAVVVTFNLHAAFDERGGWAFDRMMRELGAQRPDVAALQEVSRGWVVNGSADLYELARERLGLTGAYGPSVTTDWGNAVFVRGEIARVSTSPLPPRDLALTRAVTVVERAPEGGYPLRVVATHLHYRTGDDAIRDLQARAIATVSASPDAVLLGDFNAQPESECFAILRAAGWIDAAGTPESAARAPTFPAAQPVRRIDTIFVGDPSRVLSCEVAPSWGSDHRAVIARLRR